MDHLSHNNHITYPNYRTVSPIQSPPIAESLKLKNMPECGGCKRWFKTQQGLGAHLSQTKKTVCVEFYKAHVDCDNAVGMDVEYSTVKHADQQH